MRFEDGIISGTAHAWFGSYLKEWESQVRDHSLFPPEGGPGAKGKPGQKVYDPPLLSLENHMTPLHDTQKPHAPPPPSHLPSRGSA